MQSQIIPQGQKGHQKRSQSNPAIQSHFQQQKFFSRHQSKRLSVQQSPHLQVVKLFQGEDYFRLDFQWRHRCW